MGRLQNLTVLGLLALGACDQNAETTEGVSKSRSAAVQTTVAEKQPEALASAAALKAAAAPGSSATEPPKPPLCAGQMAKPARDLPGEGISRAGDKALAGKLPVGDDAWTWVNFWAAWCVPCKEEMPRLKAWERQLAGEKTPLRVVFVSLDDDERQLKDFLATQPADGVRSTYWLKDGKEREAWLEGIGMETEPRLPAHLLIDPKGKLRCVIEGAVEDADLPRVRHLMTRRF